MLILMMLVKLVAFCKCRARLRQTELVLDSNVIGQSPPTFDKQFLRAYLEIVDWNKALPAAPSHSRDVIEKIFAKYREALRPLTSNEIVSTEANAGQ